MSTVPYSCERPCHCQEPIIFPQFVVLTGGPGAGKTAVLEFVRKVLCEHMVILPEAASILFQGGFLRLQTPTGVKCLQRAIYHVQQEMQNLVLLEKKWAIGLCDRGTLDGLAYWPGSEAEYFKGLQTTREQEYKKYKAVIHLRTPGLERGYNFQNPHRIESAPQAAEIDKKIEVIWSQHPHYVVIESHADFAAKVERAVHQIQSLIPECCKKHWEGLNL